jgi:hypothetical protein
VLPVIGLAGLIVACAGGGGSEEEFVSMADERCRQVIKNAPVPEISTEDGAALVQEKYRQHLRHFQRLAAALHDLAPPAKLAADVEAYLVTIGQLADNRREIAAAHRTNDVARFRTLRHGFTTTNEARARLRRDIGFRVC